MLVKLVLRASYPDGFSGAWIWEQLGWKLCEVAVRTSGSAAATGKLRPGGGASGSAHSWIHGSSHLF